jgi:hypothetical protein
VRRENVPYATSVLVRDEREDVSHIRRRTTTAVRGPVDAALTCELARDDATAL